ncbi:hypothetical protein Tco_1183624 [Tanacetum coccineum]
MAEKDMHTYVSQLKGLGLETLISTYDIPLDLRPHMPDPNFRMINLLTGDTDIGIYSRIFDSSGVRIPFSSIHLEVIKHFKVHISQLVPLEGVLVRSGVSRVWCNPMCDPVLRHSDNTVMSVYDFLCMPFLDKVTVREEAYGLDTSILDRVANHTTSPAPAGTAIPRATPKEIIVTRPDRKVVTKTDNASKQKASTRPEISTNATKKTRSSKKGCGEGEHINVTLLQTFDPSIGLDVTYPPILLLDKEVEPHVELSGGVRRTTRASSHASRDASHLAQEVASALNVQPQDADDGGNGSDGNVDPYYEARVGNTAGDVLERDLLPLVPRTYYIPYPYDEELYKDPKSVVRAIEEVSTLKAQLGALESNCQTVDKKLSIWDKKHRKYKAERDAITVEKAKVKEELLKTKSQFKLHERQAEQTQSSIATFFQSDFTSLV